MSKQTSDDNQSEQSSNQKRTIQKFSAGGRLCFAINKKVCLFFVINKMSACFVTLLLRIKT